MHGSKQFLVQETVFSELETSGPLNPYTEGQFICHSLSADFGNLQKVFLTRPACLPTGSYGTYIIILPFSLFISASY